MRLNPVARFCGRSFFPSSGLFLLRDDPYLILMSRLVSAIISSKDLKMNVVHTFNKELSTSVPIEDGGPCVPCDPSRCG